jgi:hypothetical protein
MVMEQIENICPMIGFDGDNSMKYILYASLSVCLLTCVGVADTVPGPGYAMENEPTGEYYDWQKTGRPERPWLLPYHQTLVMKIFLCEKDAKGGVKQVYLSFEQALDVIKRLDNITCAIPKIVYLVGWQYDGHDSKYPSWAEVNQQLKRPQDRTALESLRWLMREGKKYHTTVSLHLNMFDAFEDSPLWDTYVKHDIIAKDRQGKVIFGEVHGGQRSSQISYTQEWNLGFAQKRIDDLLRMLPELQEGKTIQIDAFHSCRPLGRNEPISPLLGHSMAQEAATQRKIYRYWRDKGLDVTSEGSAFLRPDAFVGLQPMAWWDHPSKLPPELYCGSPMHAEQEIKHDPQTLPGLIDQFCLMVVPWYYQNNRTAVKGRQTMREPDGPLKRHPRQDLFSSVLAQYGDNICMPALWRKQRTLIAYSREGYAQKTWELPPDWKDVKQVSVSRICLDGPRELGKVTVTDNTLSLKMKPREAFLIVPLH